MNRDIKSNANVTPILPSPITATITRSVATLSSTTRLSVSMTTKTPFNPGSKILFKMPTDQIAVETVITCQTDGIPVISLV